MPKQRTEQNERLKIAQDSEAFLPNQKKDKKEIQKEKQKKDTMIRTIRRPVYLI